MYTEYPPSLLLSPFVDQYWEFKGNPESGTHIHILPDGCTDFIFTLGEVAQVAGSSFVMQPYRSFFVGPMTRYSELVTCTPTVHMLGIRFLPCGLFRFMDLPLAELTNQRIDTHDLPDFFPPFFTEELSEQPHFKARIDLIEKWLIKSLAHTGQSCGPIHSAVRQINRYHGRLPISTLAANACLCPRHFERRFKHLTGFSPKEYSRIMKFRYAVEKLRHTPSGNLLSTAVDAGYYDAAHLAKEIRTLSGSTASSFLSSAVPEEITLTYIEP